MVQKTTTRGWNRRILVVPCTSHVTHCIVTCRTVSKLQIVSSSRAAFCIAERGRGQLILECEWHKPCLSFSTLFFLSTISCLSHSSVILLSPQQCIDVLRHYYYEFSALFIVENALKGRTLLVFFSLDRFSRRGPVYLNFLRREISIEIFLNIFTKTKLQFFFFFLSKT